jgi:hypothetical protein
MPADQEIITISDTESDDDDIDHYIKTLFPPPCPPSNTKPTVKPFVNPPNELGVDLPPGVQLLPASSNVKAAYTRFPPTAKKGPAMWRKPLGQGRDTSNHRKRLIKRDGRKYIEHVLIKW